MHIFQIDNVTEWTGSDPDPIWDKFLDPNPNKMYGTVEEANFGHISQKNEN